MNYVEFPDEQASEKEPQKKDTESKMQNGSLRWISLFFSRVSLVHSLNEIVTLYAITFIKLMRHPVKPDMFDRFTLFLFCHTGSLVESFCRPLIPNTSLR